MENIYKDKKVLILGLGINEGGLGAARFFAKHGSFVKVTDLKSMERLNPSVDQLKEFGNVEFVLGTHKYEDIDWADLIIKNQAVGNDNPYLIYAQKKGKKIETDVGIFLDQISPERIIGITGSKGKTTTASLIFSAMNGSPTRKALGDEGGVILAGNIGKSVLDALDQIDQKTLIILELSSFQLEGFEQHKVSPNIALITNIFPEHLNYYTSMDDYIDAKRIIAKYQTEKDFLFLNKDDAILNSKEFLSGLRAKIEYFSSDDLPADFNPALPGAHNKSGYAGALAVAKHLGVLPLHALEAMNRFEGAEFRLQFVKEFHGIKIYNDSSATNPNATVEALETFPGSILICGGMDKGLEYSVLAGQIEKRAKAVFFLDGDATEKIKQGIKEHRMMRDTYSDLLHLLRDVKKEAEPGDTVIFSPGATSFNLFQNEFDRGRKFNNAINYIFS